MKIFFILLTLIMTPTLVTAQTEIKPADAKALLAKDKTAVLLDVRTSAEYEDQRIPGSSLLTLDKITAQSAAQFIKTKDTTVVVYCRSGARSAKAAAILKDLGYKKVLNLGGIKSWPYETQSGKP